ncbi:MAG TPA: hypothetical protein VF192_03135 [Longimicrobiales bacterium]
MGGGTADPRIRTLIERYAALVGADVIEVQPELLQITLPQAEARFFGGRRRLQVAFSMSAFERYPEADMAVVGSAILQHAIEAIRARGHNLRFGRLPEGNAGTPGPVVLSVPLLRAEASEARVKDTVRPLGRLTARVTMAAGASVTERLVESHVFDLISRTPVEMEIEELCRDLEARPIGAAGTPHDDRHTAQTLQPDALLELMVPDLEAKLGPELDRLRADAERALAAELARIDRYYKALLAEAGGRGTEVPDARAREAIQADYERRRAEEERRHRVRGTIHPVQLARFDVRAQEASWTLTSAAGRTADFSATRLVAGSGTWKYSCPTCAASPKALVVCRENHAACADCSRLCSVCGEDFCREHGTFACHVDGAPACHVHAHTCVACDRAYCSAHQGTCGVTGHHACESCLHACAVCGKSVCELHLTRSTEDAPRGARVLCPDCVVYCEGGTLEPVGRDEVVACASCDRFICEHHQVRCEVDGQPHCSRHLRPSDYSRRLVCERHRAPCAYDPAGIFAADEVHTCATCGKQACLAHVGECASDSRYHCRHHLEPLVDEPGKLACERHRTTCHLDGRAFSLRGTQPCPICERHACASHSVPCKWCGRRICTGDVSSDRGRCTTCRRLAPIMDPPDAVVMAATFVKHDRAPVRAWRMARDASHIVVEIDLGWTRKVVFSLLHGDTRPAVVVRHSLFGTRRES